MASAEAGSDRDVTAGGGLTPIAAAAATVDQVLAQLGSGPAGLSLDGARRRFAQLGPNSVGVESRSLRAIVLEQVRNGINIMLAVAGLLTIATGDLVDGAIILGLIALNVGLSIVQEYRAEKALAALRNMLPLRCRVIRDGSELDLTAEQLVPGDVVRVRSGNLVPADLRLLEVQELEINQATLTGESVPQTKSVAPVTSAAAVDWTDIAFAGTTVVGGEGLGAVIATGSRTQFGETASLVMGARVKGDFQVNLSRFASFLLRFGLLFAAGIFVSNALLGRNVLVSATLALAVALGVVPEALPAVTATTLALGAANLARKKVLVRRLAAVEDLSAIDTLCIDKTGTLTENRTRLVDSWSLIPADQVLLQAVICTSYPETGADLIDDAIIDAAQKLDLSSLKKLDRKIVMEFSAATKQMCVSAAGEFVYKGAARVLLERCDRIRTPEGDSPMDAARRGAVEAELGRMQGAGGRVLAVGIGSEGPHAPAATLVLLGLLSMSDPPRPGAAAALARARELGVEVKIVTGDAPARAVGLAGQIHLDLPDGAIIPAAELSGPGLAAAAARGRIFAEAVPADKFHLVRALQALGRHVAASGDGVNDVPAIKAADVGIAMASGTDATKGAADLVLLEDDLQVIVEGIREGRRTFTNINRYLLYTMVSNFANVIIVAIASVVLNYLPLLPDQVLLLNVLADLPMLAIVTDIVAADDLATPRHWDIRRLVELALYLGLVNAVLALGLVRYLSGSSPEVVHAAWFLFLGSTALFVLFAVRTRSWFWSRPWPSWQVLAAIGIAFLVTVGLVNVPEAKQLLHFGTLSLQQQLGIEAYSVLYLVLADLLKRAFQRTLPVLRKP